VLRRSRGLGTEARPGLRDGDGAGGNRCSPYGGWAWGCLLLREVPKGLPGGFADPCNASRSNRFRSWASL